MNWKEEIMALASERKVCKPYMECLGKQSDKRVALRLYKAGVDWALEHSFPSVKFLLDNFTRGELESAGIYMNRVFHGEVINNHIFQVFHNCSGLIKVELNLQKLIIPTLYVANDSHLQVEVDEDIDISVFLFDKSKVDVKGKWKLRTVVPDPSIADSEFKPNLSIKDL